MCAWIGTFNSGLRESVKILCSYFRVECQKCVSQRPSNMASFRALEHNQAKLSKFPGLHLQRSIDTFSSSYLVRLFIYRFQAMEVIPTETCGLWGSVSLSGKVGRRVGCERIQIRERKSSYAQSRSKKKFLRESTDRSRLAVLSVRSTI